MSKLITISGPSGVGKGTIVKLLKEKYQEENKKLYISISCTTRSPREGEIDGREYYFISEEEFLNKIEEGDFLEYNKYGTGRYYGTPKSKVEEYLKNGYDVILEIDINGSMLVKESLPETITIFVDTPSIEDLKERLSTRGTETEEQIKMRIETALNELARKDVCDYIIVNYDGKSKEAMEEIYNILNKK